MCQKISINVRLIVNDDVTVSAYQSTDIEMSKPNTDPDTIFNKQLNVSRSISKQHTELFDFSKILNISCSSAEYASTSQDSINKIKECYELFNFLIDSSKIVEMLMFKDAYDISLRDLNNLFNSNFSRANRLHSTLLETINQYKFCIKCLESKILSYDIDKFHQIA